MTQSKAPSVKFAITGVLSSDCGLLFLIFELPSPHNRAEIPLPMQAQANREVPPLINRQNALHFLLVGQEQVLGIKFLDHHIAERDNCRPHIRLRSSHQLIHPIGGDVVAEDAEGTDNNLQRMYAALSQSIFLPFEFVAGAHLLIDPVEYMLRDPKSPLEHDSRIARCTTVQPKLMFRQRLHRLVKIPLSVGHFTRLSSALLPTFVAIPIATVQELL